MTPDEQIEALKQRVRDLETTLNQNGSDLAVTFRLTPSLNNILGLLLAIPVVTATAIEHRLGVTTDAKVSIHRLRKELGEWDIEVHSKRSLGYWLDAETKERIHALVKKTLGLPDEPKVVSAVKEAPATEEGLPA